MVSLVVPARAPVPRAARRRARLPSPAQLAALGAVLCLSRTQAGGALGGWAQAVRAEVGGGVDSDGLRGQLQFFDRDGRCCWRLYLLPDSDFLAWERLCAVLPRRHDEDAPVAERLWRQLAARLRAGPWQASVLRLHALPLAPGFATTPPLLAASLARLSPLGADSARRIAEAEGAGRPDVAIDDCCCRSAFAPAAIPMPATTARDVYSLIRLTPTERA